MELKALEILRKYKKICEKIFLGDEYSDGNDSYAKDIKEIDEAIEEFEALSRPKVSRICKNCESWQNECCIQTEFENGTKADNECFIIGFKEKQ